MASRKGRSLRSINTEIDRLGATIRGLTNQIAGMRARVSDLELWDITLLMRGKRSGKKKGKVPKKKHPKRPRYRK